MFFGSLHPPGPPAAIFVISKNNETTLALEYCGSIFNSNKKASDHVFMLAVEQRFHSFPVPWIELSALIHVSYMEVAMNG